MDEYGCHQHEAEATYLDKRVTELKFVGDQVGAE
jgi:hypothetical protein